MCVGCDLFLIAPLFAFFLLLWFNNARVFQPFFLHRSLFPHLELQYTKSAAKAAPRPGPAMP